MNAPSQAFRITAATGLHRGDRAYQQDQVEVVSHGRVQGCALAMVADGMGGKSGGRKAADQVILTGKQVFERFVPAKDDGAELLRQLVMESHLMIKLTAITAEEEPHSTVAAFLVTPALECDVVHAGDSRVYHYRGQEMVRRTSDHSFVQRLIDEGKLTEDEQAGCAREWGDEAAAELLHRRERELFAKRKGREPTAQEAEALRAKHEQSVAERVQLAKGCYYGQERKSVEDLQERYVSRSARREGLPRMRPNPAQSIVEALSSAPSPGAQTQRVEAYPGIADAEQAADLRDALATLPAEQRAEVQRFLRGRGQISKATRESLQEQMG